MTINNIKASFLWRYHSYIIIVGLVVGIVGARYDVGATFHDEPLPHYPKEKHCDTVCIIEQRTMMVHERDANKYLEQSRLTAMYELNSELQALTYESPYINQ